MNKQPATYYHVKGSRSRVQIHQGGTRSGKTYSILTAIIELLYRNQNRRAVVTICRKTLPALRATAMRDFFEILERENLYNPTAHNKSAATYRLFGNIVEFISIDQPTKVRGRKRDLLFINEANEVSLEDWRQLLLRTTGKVIIDYNPSDEYHWIYEHVLTRDDAEFFQTTYLDNPYLEPSVIAEIERLKEVDENYWRVYGLGERAVGRSTILTHYTIAETRPEGFKLLNYGLDFGFTNDPTAIVAVYTDGRGFYLEELCYATGMTNADISRFLRETAEAGVAVIADSAEPKSIHEIHGHGLNVHPARKGPDSIRAGLQFMQSRPLAVSAASENLIKELRNYKWSEDKNGRLLNVPVAGNDHLIDAARYALMWNQSKPNFGKYVLG